MQVRNNVCFANRSIRYMAVLANPKGAIGVMLAFFLFTLMCAWSATNLSNEFSPSEIVPDDSYTKAYFSAASKLGLFWDSSIPYDVIFKVRETQILLRVNVILHTVAMAILLAMPSNTILSRSKYTKVL